MLIPAIVFIFLESVRQAQYIWFKKKHEGLLLQLTGWPFFSLFRCHQYGFTVLSLWVFSGDQKR